MNSNKAPTEHIERFVSKQTSGVIVGVARKRRIVFEVAVGGIRVTGLSRPVRGTHGEDGRMSSSMGLGTSGFIFLIAMLMLVGCWFFMCAIGC